MLHSYIAQFLHYCQALNFPAKSLETLRCRLNEFKQYCQSLSLESVLTVTYRHLLTFVADFGSPSVHVRKSRVWALRHNFKNSEHTTALFVSKKGNRLAIRTMEDNIKKLVDSLRLDVHFKVTCHTLRHTFASHLNDNGEDILVIQSLLGHSSPRSTRIYIHPSEKRIRQALEKLPGVIHMNQLLQSGVWNLNFQPKHRQKE
jgi:site-specific recombinase XerD